MATHLTILVENTVPPKSDDLFAAHGFSVFIDRPGTRLLVDTGPQRTPLLHNAMQLGIDLRSADAIVLSHGHGDHTGGMAAVLALLAREIPVYGHPGIFAQRYGKRKDGVIRSNSLPFTRETLEGNGARFDLSPEFRAIAPGVYLTGEIPRRHVFETGDAHLFVRVNGTEMRDPFIDDQSLVLDTAEGLALILGCCHAGLLNTIAHVQERLPGKPIHTVIGGTHLGPAPPAQLHRTIEALREVDICRLGLSHCTGLQAGARLAAAFPDRVMFCNVGTSLMLE